MANRDNIRQTLIQFLREDSPADMAIIDDSTELRGGLGLDSVDFVGLVMRIEGHYRIRLSREELDGLGTVGDFLTLLEGKASVPGTSSDAAAA